MANADKLKGLKSTGLSDPPKAGAGNITLLDRAKAMQQAKAEAETAKVEAAVAKAEAAEVERAALEEQPAKKKSTGRPKLDYPTQQLGARVHRDTFRRVQIISKRERVGLGPLVDRMVREWERMRLDQAQAIGPRQEGESDDDYIARVFRL